MDGLPLETLIPGAGAFSAFTAAVVLLIKILGHDRSQLVAADKRYRNEVADHERTQDELERERGRRHGLEDQVAELTRQVGAVTSQMREQAQTIRRLETEVARLTGLTGAAT